MTAKIQDLHRLKAMCGELSQLDSNLSIPNIDDTKTRLEKLEEEFNKYSNWRTLSLQYPRRQVYDSFASLIQSTNQRLIALSQLRKNIKIDVDSPPIAPSAKSSPTSRVLVFRGTTIPIAPEITPHTPSKSSQGGRQSLEFEEPALTETPKSAVHANPTNSSDPHNDCCVIL